MTTLPAAPPALHGTEGPPGREVGVAVFALRSLSCSWLCPQGPVPQFSPRSEPLLRALARRLSLECLSSIGHRPNPKGQLETQPSPVSRSPAKQKRGPWARSQEGTRARGEEGTVSSGRGPGPVRRPEHSPCAPLGPRLPTRLPTSQRGQRLPG